MIKETIKLMLSDVRAQPAIQGDIWDFFSRVSNYILFISAILIAPLLYLVAVFYFLTAAGETEKITRARNLLFWTTIGLIVILIIRGFFMYLSTIF